MIAVVWLFEPPLLTLQWHLSLWLIVRFLPKLPLAWPGHWTHLHLHCYHYYSCPPCLFSSLSLKYSQAGLGRVSKRMILVHVDVDVENCWGVVVWPKRAPGSVTFAIHRQETMNPRYWLSVPFARNSCWHSISPWPR